MMHNHHMFMGGGKGVLTVADLFASTPYTVDDQSIARILPLDFVPDFNWHKPRGLAGSSALRDTSQPGTFLSSSSTGVPAATSAILTGDVRGFPQPYTSAGAGQTVAAWSWKKAPKFFDIVRFTGTGSARRIAHDLGIAPGLIIIKRLDAAGSWWTYHRSTGRSALLQLNSDSLQTNSTSIWGAADPTNTDFGLGPSTLTNNISGAEYIAYLFAHDTASDGMIQCGSYTGNGSVTGPAVMLGWMPQWLLIKRTTTSVADWWIIDSARVSGANELALTTNTTAAEVSTSGVNWLGDGFRPTATTTNINASAATYAYMAIRTS